MRETLDKIRKKYGDNWLEILLMVLFVCAALVLTVPQLVGDTAEVLGRSVNSAGGEDGEAGSGKSEAGGLSGGADGENGEDAEAGSGKSEAGGLPGSASSENGEDAEAGSGKDGAGGSFGSTGDVNGEDAEAGSGKGGAGGSFGSTGDVNGEDAEAGNGKSEAGEAGSAESGQDDASADNAEKTGKASDKKSADAGGKSGEDDAENGKTGKSDGDDTENGTAGNTDDENDTENGTAGNTDGDSLNGAEKTAEDFVGNQLEKYGVFTLRDTRWIRGLYPTYLPGESVLLNYEELAGRAYRLGYTLPAAGIAALTGSASGQEQKAGRDLTLLQSMIENRIAEYDGDWSVYVKNLSTDESIVINDTPMKSASVMKLFIMGTVYKAIEAGELERTDEVMSLMNSMITVSDNEASNQLLYLLGDGSYEDGIACVDAFIEEYGFSEMTVEYNGFNNSATVMDSSRYNQVSAKDCGKLLEDIYRRTWVNRSVSNEIEEMLLNQHTRYKIPAGLPDGVLCGNKTGEMDTTENDAAIVYAGECDYILVVLSSDWDSKDQAISRIASISSMVYEFLN